MTENNKVGKSLFGLQVSAHHQRKPKGIWYIGTEAETMEEDSLLTGFLWLAQLISLQNPGQPTQRQHCPQWAGPPYIK